MWTFWIQFARLCGSFPVSVRRIIPQSENEKRVDFFIEKNDWKAQIQTENHNRFFSRRHFPAKCSSGHGQVENRLDVMLNISSQSSKNVRFVQKCPRDCFFERRFFLKLFPLNTCNADSANCQEFSVNFQNPLSHSQIFMKKINIFNQTNSWKCSSGQIECRFDDSAGTFLSKSENSSLTLRNLWKRRIL